MLVPQAVAQEPAPVSPLRMAQAYYQRGLKEVDEGNVKIAEAAFTKALEYQPRHSGAQYQLGQLRIHADQIEARGREKRFNLLQVKEINVDGASLEESLLAVKLAIQAADEKVDAPVFLIQDPEKKLQAVEISFQLKGVPARAALDFIAKQANARVRFDSHAIIVSPM